MESGTNTIQKMTKKEIQANKRATEESTAKTMSYESIIDTISTAKKARDCIRLDIAGLCKKELEQDALISKMNRILLFKKKQAGA